jgi:hypothetical protein
MSNVKYHNVIPTTKVHNKREKKKKPIIIQYHHDTPAGAIKARKRKCRSIRPRRPFGQQNSWFPSFHAILSLTSWRGWPRACIRNVQTRHRHPPFSRPIAVSSSARLRSRSRSRSRGRRIIASSIAHTQSSASDPTMSARNGKWVVGVGVDPPPASGTCALSSSLSKGECMHPEEEALLFCGLPLPSRYRP